MTVYPFDGMEPCREIGTEVFFPPSEDTHAYRPAQEICGTCHHEAECLTWAIATDSAYGVFGGMTPRQRLMIKRRSA